MLPLVAGFGKAKELKLYGGQLGGPLLLGAYQYQFVQTLFPSFGPK